MLPNELEETCAILAQTIPYQTNQSDFVAPQAGKHQLHDIEVLHSVYPKSKGGSSVQKVKYSKQLHALES